MALYHVASDLNQFLQVILIGKQCEQITPTQKKKNLT